MLKERIEKMLNDQMNFEMYSAYLYKAMGAYCDSIDLSGFANWFKIQGKEENFHTEKIYDYLLERGGRPFFTAIEAPKKDWESLKAAFENTLEHEQLVTEKVNTLMTAAIEENDHATRSFLNWFVDEQVEEESNTDRIIKQLKLLEGSSQGLFMMDKEMALRVFTPPAP